MRHFSKTRDVINEFDLHFAAQASCFSDSLLPLIQCCGVFSFRPIRDFVASRAPIYHLGRALLH